MIQLTEEEYKKLRKASLKLQALEQNGVDNWDWYGSAMDTYQEFLEAEDLEE